MQYGGYAMSKVIEFSLPMKGFSQSPRKIWIYLPDPALNGKKCDVMYMFDGHNLFFDEVATYGKSWGMRTYLDEAKADLIVVGQDCNHTGNNRLAEYCPFHAEETYIEPLPAIRAKGRQTAEWFVQVLIPYAEKNYPVKKGRMHRGIGGSSMGGLMAEYMISQYNDIFAKAACVSPSTHFNYNALMKQIEDTQYRDTWIYIDQGSQEVHGKRRFIDEVDTMLKISHAWNMKGCHTYPHLTPGGHHSEADWERVVPTFCEYLFPEAFHV